MGKLAESDREFLEAIEEARRAVDRGEILTQAEVLRGIRERAALRRQKAKPRPKS